VLTDLFDRKPSQLVLVKLEFAKVCREVNHSFRVEQISGGVEKVNMSLLHIPIIIEPFTVGVSGWVDDDDIVLPFSL